MVHQELISLEDHGKWLELQVSGDVSTLCRVAFYEGTPFGVISLNRLDLLNRNSDWGMYIGDPEFLGRGLAKLLLWEIQKWGFDSLNLNRLYTSVFSDNVNALGLYLRAGFQVEGLWRQHLWVHGVPKDLYWVAMHQKSWVVRKESIRQWAFPCGS